MKFLCDKCKTRYSIGDDRVRGKILKIRCKNCANVITVREGMDAEADEAGSSRGRPTTGAHAVMASAPAGSALGAAFANQLAKPPPALEEEWYVSIDGVQSGPFSLGDAQRWITSKPFDAELHCWSEGFDDWLPVDKVSHFRNLRKKPEPRAARQSTVPPPIPRREDEPKPLFAATMASLEKGVAPAALPPHKPIQPARPEAKGSIGDPNEVRIADSLGRGSPSRAPATTRTNGHTSPPTSTGRGSGPSPAIPKVSAGAAALAAAFKEPADEDSSEPMTRVEAPPFHDEVAAKPSAALRVEAKPVPAPIHQNDDDDDLEIGEVSRVVKLADIASMGRRAPTSSGASSSMGSTGSVPRINTAQSGASLRSTGSMPRLNATGAMPRVGGLTGSSPKLTPGELGMNVGGEPHADESMVAHSFATKHRRGLLILLTASAVMVLGVVAAVVFVVSGGSDDELPGGLGGTRQVDTSRPEDIVRRALPPTPGEGPGSAIAKVDKPRPRITNTNPTNQTPEVEDPKGGSLRASDIEDMAAKQGEGTKRCYMRAQKGAIGFEIADLKKIDVTLTVGKDGVVNDVNLSSHGGDSFGQCLIARIKGWKFRESNGGTFRISLAFAAS